MTDDVLDLPLRTVLERLLAAAPAAESDPWVDLRADEIVPWRQAVAAAERGELALSRIGRKLLVQRSELDAWIATHRITPRAEPKPAPATATPSRVAHLLEASGFRRSGAAR